MAKRYSGKDLQRAIDCVRAVQASDIKMLASRQQAAAEALAGYIFDLDDPNRTKFIDAALAPLEATMAVLRANPGVTFKPAPKEPK